MLSRLPLTQSNPLLLRPNYSTPPILPCYPKKLRLHTVCHSTEDFTNLDSNNDNIYIPKSQQQPQPTPPQRRSYPPRRNSQQRLQDLIEYINTHGHADVPYRHPGGLGKWCVDQRQRWRKGILPVKDYHSLISLGFIFDTYQLKWEEQFKQLAAFHSTYGHCSPHEKYGEEWASLKVWVYTQRRLEAAGELEDGRRRRLGGLGFVWRSTDERWESKYKELKSYKERFGHCTITTATLISIMNNNSSDDSNDNNGVEAADRYRKLGYWVSDQRGLWREGKLSRDREGKLIDLGLEMDPSFKRWQRKLQQTVEMKERGKGFNGKQQVWLGKQMSLLKEGRTDDKRVQVLEKVQALLLYLEWDRERGEREEEALPCARALTAYGWSHPDPSNWVYRYRRLSPDK